MKLPPLSAALHAELMGMCLIQCEVAGGHISSSIGLMAERRREKLRSQLMCRCQPGRLDGDGTQSTDEEEVLDIQRV